jgi:hypothetical protein
LALVGLAFVATQGCASSSSQGREEMQMSADLYPTSGKTSEAVAMPEWVLLYSRSVKGASVVVLRGGIRSVRVHSNSILIHEQVVGAKSTWKIVVYDAPTDSLMVSDAETNSPVVVSNKVARNRDGSVDLHFGLSAPLGGENNWIRTSTEIPW